MAMSVVMVMMVVRMTRKHSNRRRVDAEINDTEEANERSAC